MRGTGLTSGADRGESYGNGRNWDSTVQRSVSVKGSGGVTATIVVTVRRGKVWVSIQPPFTWSAIMEHGKVAELRRTLALATEDAQRMTDLRPAKATAGPNGRDEKQW